jgi:hypothetical protein
MYSRIKNLSFLGISTLGLLSACFSPSSISASGDAERLACYQNWRDGVHLEHHWLKRGLSFEVTSLLFNLTNEPISGVAEARVFSPDGKETFLGAVEFNSVGFLDFVPLVFPLKRASGSKAMGEYHTVIDIRCSQGGQSFLSTNLIGNVSVFKQQWDHMSGEETAVSFIDLDFNATAKNFQVSSSFYNHHHQK